VWTLSRSTVAAVVAVVVLGAPAFAVNPLVTDDADTVERGHLQLNAGWVTTRAGSTDEHAVPVNPVVGIHSRGELGATLGYVWPEEGADGISDLTLETKWWLGEHSDDGLNLAFRVDVKVPTASTRKGLGTGDVDVDAIAIGTRSWERLSLDWNVAYTVVDASRGVFGDDRWFLGQAVRYQVTERWTAIGETFGLLPHTDRGGFAQGHFNAGAQFLAVDHLLLSVLVGTAVGRDSHDFASYLGFTVTS
jgi:hypothetical protein